MKVIIAITFLIALAAAQSGIAIIRGTVSDPGVWGWATFVTNTTSNLVDVTINITGITNNPDSLHGIHVHMWGDTTDPTGNAAGGHFTAGAQVHACPPNTSRHFGDMGNWQATGGIIADTKSFDLLTLTGVNSIIGRGLILHNGTDDCATQPTGNSGSRLGQAVIGIMNITGNTASNGMTRTSTGLDIAVCNLIPIAGNAENITGYGYMTQGATGGVYVIVQLSGVSGTNVHAVHIHQYGDLRTAASVGGHWNPVTQRHGMYGYPAHHAGDLGNVYLFPNANQPAANFTQWTNNSFNVVGGDFNVVGHALVVHQNRDDCSDPIGNSGNRFATCVWGIANSNVTANATIFNPAFPTGLTTAYDAITIANCTSSFNLTTTTTTTTTGTTTGTTTTGTTTAGPTTTTTTTATATGVMTTASITGSASLVVFSVLTVLAAMLF